MHAGFSQNGNDKLVDDVPRTGDLACRLADSESKVTELSALLDEATEHIVRLREENRLLQERLLSLRLGGRLPADTLTSGFW